MSSTQDSKRQSLLNMVQGGDGHTEDYIEDIPPSEGGGCIYHSIRDGRELRQYILPRESAEKLLKLLKSDL